MTRLDPVSGPLLREVHHSSPDLMRARYAEIREQLAAAQDAFETERLMWAPKRQEERT